MYDSNPGALFVHVALQLNRFGLADSCRTPPRRVPLRCSLRRCPEKLGAEASRSTNVQPGPIDTDLNPASGDWAVPQKAATALDRYGKVDEIAAMVAFVAGPESSYITGANLTVDGGMNA